MRTLACILVGILCAVIVGRFTDEIWIIALTGFVVAFSLMEVVS